MNTIKPGRHLIGVAAALLLGGAAQVRAQDRSHFMDGLTDPSKHAIEVKSQGYFFAGGRYFTAADGAGPFMVDQMYVEYQIPKEVKHPYPVVLIPRRRADGDVHDGDAGQSSRLEHVLPGERLRGLRRRPDGSRQVGLSRRHLRADHARQRDGAAAALYRGAAVQPVAAGPPSHAVARLGADGRS